MITKVKEMDTVSVVIPVYNEERYIKKLIESIRNQDYDNSKLEIIFVDGNSKDRTVEIIKEEMKKVNIKYKILKNPEKITPKSVNMGIKEAQNDIIMRLDAHSEYPENYISKCVYYLNNTDADNVGCLFYATGTSNIGKAIANVVSSRFGVGNSGFRTNAESGYVDTVPFGTFRKELFEKIGYFNEELIRSEDNEFNYRINANGGKVYLFNELGIKYYPRDTIQKIMKMGFDNGKWAIYTNYIIPGSMKLRHFIPLLFVLGIIFGTIATILKIKCISIIFAITMIIYMLLDMVFTVKHVIKDGISQLICFIIYPLFHISYGIGSIGGVFKIIKRGIENVKSKKNNT